jgi:AraC-like DNA-binding protein
VTAALVRKVEELIGCGLSEDDTARAIGCSTETLRKHFAENIRTARAKKRAEAIQLLWKSARAGNVAAQKKLEEMTGRAVAEEAVLGDRPQKAEKRGKKEQAAANAETAGVGTSWGDDLHVGGRLPN